MTTYIYAEKGGQTTRFTKMIWKNMGKKKNGWVEITKAQYEGKAPTGKATDTPPDDLTDEKRYRELYDQGKGFEKDGKFTEARERYEAALALKSSPTLKGKINKMVEAEEQEAERGNRAELVEMGDHAMAVNDFETALESYEAAQEIEQTGDVKKKIEKAKKEQADAMVE